jgi:hypothetical protein
MLASLLLLMSFCGWHFCLAVVPVVAGVSAAGGVCTFSSFPVVSAGVL